jgi:hypothetical protein
MVRTVTTQERVQTGTETVTRTDPATGAETQVTTPVFAMQDVPRQVQVSIDEQIADYVNRDRDPDNPIITGGRISSEARKYGEGVPLGARGGPQDNAPPEPEPPA